MWRESSASCARPVTSRNRAAEGAEHCCREVWEVQFGTTTRGDYKTESRVYIVLAFRLFAEEALQQSKAIQFT